MALLAFDMEIATPVPDSTDLLATRPGIGCAAFMREGEARPLVVFDPTEAPELFVPETKSLTKAGATLILDALIRGVAAGDTLLTWNGASFDFRLLANETGRHADCAALTRKSVDMMFWLVCERGHPLALESALKGMGLPTKLHTVDLPDGRTIEVGGALAPQLWQAGEYKAVMTYCGGDVETTLALAVECRKLNYLAWNSRNGRANRVPLPGRWLTVEECLALPVPNTSWMKEPLRREDVLAWMDRDLFAE